LSRVFADLKLLRIFMVAASADRGGLTMPRRPFCQVLGGLGIELTAAAARAISSGKCGETDMAVRNGGWIGFLVMTFAVVGLTGLFASYAAPLPLERAMLREAAFDAVLSPGLSEVDRAALRDRLGEDAASLLDGASDLPQRVQLAREAARKRFELETDAVGNRLRLLMVVVTCAGALFSVAILNVAVRRI